MQKAHREEINAKINRRTFLHRLLTAAGGVVATACGSVRESDPPSRRAAFDARATPQILLPSPIPPTPVADARDELLPAFLALSTALTGVENLSPELGSVYLQSLQNGAAPESASSIQTLLEQVTEDENSVDAAALLQDEATRGLAQTITKLWYSGTYTNAAGEQTVATYVDALAWQTLRFTKPKTLCGYPGFWAEAWPAALE